MTPLRQTVEPAAGRWAAAVLILGLLGHALLFVRIAVLFAPGMYLGPSGSDRLFYFDYVRSIVIDRDLDFRDEMALWPPSSGLVVRGETPINKYPIGAPLLSLPAYAATHAVMAASSAAEAAPRGYGRPYVYAYALSQLTFGLVGFVLLFRVMRRYFGELISAIAVVGAAFGTELLRYTAADLLMSHAASFFSLSLCLLASVRLREAPERTSRWVACGAAAAFVVLVRFQNGLFLVVPAAAVLVALGATARAPIGVRLRHVGAAIAGGSAVLAPQLLAWRVMTGEWIFNGYSEEVSFTWLAPHVHEVASLLAKWAPLLVIGAIGTLILAIKRRDAIVAAALLCMVGSTYVTASWWAYAIAPRTTFDNLAPIAFGLAGLAAALRRLRPGSEWAVLVLPGLWNVPFMMLPIQEAGRAGDLLADWYRGVRLLL